MPDLEAILAEAFRLLLGGAADPRSPFRTPTLATTGLDGAPSLRSVILRAALPEARHLHIHTDRRSAKAAELAADPRAALHAYDAAAQVQLRLAGTARLHLDDAEAEAAWAASRAPSRRIYAAASPPGTPVPSPTPAPTDAEAGRRHFALLAFAFHRLEWLHLAGGSHRRACFAWGAGGGLAATWLAP